MTEFCGVTGDLSTLLSDRQYSSADSAVFHFDVSLQNQYDSSILFVSSEWLPNFESDRMATVSVIICKPRERGQHRLNTTVISSQSAFIKQKKCPYRSIRLSNIIDPNERNNNEPVQMLLVLRSEGFGHKKLPNEFRPYLQLGSRPQPRRPRTKYTSSCKQGQKHCCLDSKHLNIRNDLHNTSVGQLDIVEPENLHVHFCRGTCLRITANLLINTIENNVRPLSNERCCVPDGFNPIEVSVRAKNGRLQKKMLRSIDAKGCKCIH